MIRADVLFLLFLFFSFLFFRSIGENYNAIQQNFETPVASQSAREKTRSRATSSPRGSRVIQQTQQQQQQEQQQQQQSTYQTSAQQQNAGFQPSQAQSSYAMEIQLTSVQNQQQIATLNNLNVPSGHVQNLVTVQHNFTPAASSPLQTQQQRAIRPLPPAPPLSTKPYKIVQPQQCYKFPSNLAQSLNVQCKFNADGFKVSLHTRQQ